MSSSTLSAAGLLYSKRYFSDTKAGVSGGAVEKAIFDAAFAIVDGRRMLAKRGVRLTWRDCDALRDAIKLHPAHHA